MWCDEMEWDEMRRGVNGGKFGLGRNENRRREKKEH